MVTTKVFMCGRSQAVRMPKEFRFDGDEVFIQRVGRGVLLLPRDDPWQSLIDGAGAFSEDFMESRDQPDQDTTLVTNNEREFSRVAGLRVENWVAGLRVENWVAADA